MPNTAVKNSRGLLKKTKPEHPCSYINNMALHNLVHCPCRPSSLKPSSKDVFSRLLTIRSGLPAAQSAAWDMRVVLPRVWREKEEDKSASWRLSCDPKEEAALDPARASNFLLIIMFRWPRPEETHCASLLFDLAVDNCSFPRDTFQLSPQCQWNYRAFKVCRKKRWAAGYW